MRFCVTLLALGLLGLCPARSEDGGNNRRGRVFSLFNVVQFRNDGCRSTQVQAGTGATSLFRNGTCFTASECAVKGGDAAGTCASGFGVCCVFRATTSGSEISQNCSYIQNPGFPFGVTAANEAITYTINRQCSTVCKIRLDFDRFELNGLLGGTTCADTFKVTLANRGPLIPVICGFNTGQHMYLDIGSAEGNTATLAFSLSTASSALRAWDIKVTQVNCEERANPPDDCLQYYEGLIGQFSTFNYIAGGLGHYLPNQHYSSCIRQEEGYCCVEFLQCDSTANSFNLPAIGAGAQHDKTGCVPATTPLTAYLGIPGSSGSCVPSSNSGLTSIYCGSALSPFTTGTVPIAVCDCTSPFRLDFFSTTVAAANKQGACVTLRQLPCK